MSMTSSVLNSCNEPLSAFHVLMIFYRYNMFVSLHNIMGKLIKGDFPYNEKKHSNDNNLFF